MAAECDAGTRGLRLCPSHAQHADKGLWCYRDGDRVSCRLKLLAWDLGCSAVLHELNGQCVLASVTGLLSTSQHCCGHCADNSECMKVLAAGGGHHSRLAAESRGTAEPEPAGLTVSSASSLGLKWVPTKRPKAGSTQSRCPEGSSPLEQAHHPHRPTPALSRRLEASS